MTQDFATTGRLSVSGAELACRDVATGVPVVLVHGSVADLRLWDRVIVPLGARYRVIAYSRRYATPNAPIPPDTDDPLPVHADDLVAVTEFAGEPVHLVGHSLGGFIALLAALRRPDRIRSLTLIEPPVIPLYLDIPPTPAGILSMLLRAPRAGLTILRFAATTIVPATQAFKRGDDRAAVDAFGNGVLGKARYVALPPDRRKIVWENRLPERAQLLGVGYPSLDDDEIAAFDRPVLLVQSAEGPEIFKLLIRRLDELLPNSRVETISGASHIVPEDAPVAFSAMLTSFLAAH
jgi:pimeloyl-ACP methyl ester carboxylesterase